MTKSLKHTISISLLILLCLTFYSCDDPIILLWNIILGFFSGGGPYDKTLDLTFVSQDIYVHYCAPACIAMWSKYDRPTASSTMETIAAWFYEDNNGGLPTCGSKVGEAVEEYTDSNAYEVSCSLSDRDRMLNTIIESFDQRGRPTIFVINTGTHAIILNRVRGDKPINSTSLSYIGFKDPEKTQSNVEWNKSELYNAWNDSSSVKCNRYVPLVTYIWGQKKKSDMSFSPTDFDPVESLRIFYKVNGTYYGGPESYTPEGITNIVRVKSPLGTEQLALGQQTSIEWEFIGLSGSIKLELLKGDTYWGTIATNLPISQGSYSWNIGQYQGGTATEGDDYKIRITMMDGSDYDTSNVDFSITPQLPDVVITNITMIPTAPIPGGKVTIKATIKNDGLADTPIGIGVSAAFKVDGTPLGSFFVRDANFNLRSLAAGESYTEACAVQWTAAAGTHDIWVMADDVDRFSESNEGNNVKEITTANIPNVLPDVVVTKIWLDPAAPAPGQKVNVWATIKNQGSVATPEGTNVSAAFKVDGVSLGSFFVRDANWNLRSLAAGEVYSEACAVQWTATSGNHTFWVKADDVNRFPESNENNNILEKSVAVLPDVVITNVWLVPAAPAPGQKVSVWATIKNQGITATPNGISVAAAFKVDGVSLGSFFVRDANWNLRSLAAGESYSEACAVQWTATSGSHAFWVMADDVNRFPESNDNNNVKTVTKTIQ